MRHSSLYRLGVAVLALGALGACENFDFDLRGKMGGGFNTADAARQATAKRPEPDSRGIISYPNYQVAVARRGDTLSSLAGRVGANVNDLARYNGIQPGDTLRAGEIIALPNRVAEPPSGPIRPAGEVDIGAVAGAAIERASAPEVTTSELPPSQPAIGSGGAVQTGAEPARHKVERGETAYTVARLYNVSVRSLAEWNGLGPELGIREGQYLLIPVVLDTGSAPKPPAPTTQPGAGSPTPTPPSSTKPLPAETPKPAAVPVAKPASPDLGKSQTAASTAPKGAMLMPVDGKIIREYTKGKNDGIDISAPAGTVVKAAASGKVGAITTDASGKSIVVIKHPDGLLTVYANVSGIRVKKDDSISRGQAIAEVSSGSPSYMRFGVYKGSSSTDPMPFLR